MAPAVVRWPAREAEHMYGPPLPVDNLQFQVILVDHCKLHRKLSDRFMNIGPKCLSCVIRFELMN